MDEMFPGTADFIDDEPEEETSKHVVIEEDEDPIVYATPRAPIGSYIAEAFDDVVSFEKNWIKSKAKKEGVEADLAKYDGLCSTIEAVYVKILYH